MAQMNWVFLDAFGGRHRVGLYHGDRTGHVMIQCNLRIIQIDFSVKDTKMYSFFIEDDLCEIILEKKDGVFGYAFRVNKTVDTPLNRIRRTRDGQERKHLAMLIGGLTLVLAFAFFGLRWYGQNQEAKRYASTSVFGKYNKENVRRLALEGSQTYARLHLVIPDNPKHQRISYTLLAVDSIMEQGDFRVPISDPILLPNGFPCSEGDEFGAVYLPQDPGVHRVDFFQPARNTISAYINMAIQAEQRSHPGLSSERCACRVLAIADRVGWHSLAHFIFQDSTVKQNPDHNRETYAHLIQDPELSTLLQLGCQNK